MRKVSSALFKPKSDTNNNKSIDGLLLMAPRHHVSSSPALFQHSNLFNQKSRVPCDDGISICSIFKFVAQKRICVVRRAGSDIDQQISSVLAVACRAVGRDPPTDISSAAHFLTVDHHNAGKMLDHVRRQGLPLIFLNGDCVGGLAELKQLTRNGFLAESLCAHDFDLVVIGCGKGNAAAERAVEEAVKLGKRVALVQVKQQNGSRRTAGDESFVDPLVAKQMANQAALMRHSIEEAQMNGWTVEDNSTENGKINFWLDWRCVREGIAQKTLLKRERMERTFKQGQVQLFPVTACHFSGSHELSFCQSANGDLAQSKLAKLSADKFLLVPRSEWKALENVPGAKEFCISNDELFSLEHNPGKTLFFCDNEADPQLLESAAILRALGNDVTVMTNTYSPRRVKVSKMECFDSELILSIKDKLCQLGIRLFISLPTKFELLREATEDKAAILRVYATSAWSKMAETGRGGTGGDWAPFVEEFNTVVVSVGGRSSNLAEELVPDNIGFRSSKPTPPSISDSNGFARNGSIRKICSTSEILKAPNIYAIGDAQLEQRWRGETSPQAQSEEGNCQRVKMLLQRMYESEFDTMENDEPPPLVSRTMFIPPGEYSCCGLSEEEAESKFGRHLIRVYKDGQVPIKAERAKMICVKGTAHPKRESVVGLHIIGPKASQLLEGYALAMQLGLTKWQLEQNNWQKKVSIGQ